MAATRNESNLSTQETDAKPVDPMEKSKETILTTPSSVLVTASWQQVFSLREVQRMKVGMAFRLETMTLWDELLCLSYSLAALAIFLAS